MLELAIYNQEELQKAYSKAIMREENKYYYLDSFFEYYLNIEQSEYNRIQYVSKGKDGDLLWYLGAWTNREHNRIDKLEIINLSDKPSFEGARDLIRFIHFLLIRKNFRKIIFHVVKNNPIISSYERFIIGKKIGRKSGEYKDHLILTDGKCYDMIVFEILKDDFLKSDYMNYI